MTVRVELVDGDHRISGEWDGTGQANAFLGHLAARAFSPATVRAYAFDVANLGRFLIEEGLELAAVTPMDVFAWVDWQGVRRDGTRAGKVVVLRRQTAAASTVNRRVAAVRAFFEYLVMTGARTDTGAVAATRPGHSPCGPRSARSSGVRSPAGWWQAGASASPSARVAVGR